MLADGLGDPLAAPQPGGDELVGVGLVGGGAGGADGGSSVTARFEQHPVGQLVAPEHAYDLAGGAVDPLGGTDEPDGVGAPSGCSGPVPPGVELLRIGSPGQDLRNVQTFVPAIHVSWLCRIEAARAAMAFRVGSSR